MKKSLFTAFFATILICTVSAQRSFVIPINSTQPSLLTASAGQEPTLVGSDLVLGEIPSANGGIEPYTYQWLPSVNLDDPTLANPIFAGISSAIYTLVITDGRGCSAADTIQIIILGLSENTDPTDLKIYPNPGSGRIQIEKPTGLNLTVTQIILFDLSGKKVLNSQWPDITAGAQIDVSKLAKGQYHLVLDDGTEKISSKIIIQ